MSHKEHSDEEFWKYSTGCMIVYRIDGIFRTWGESVHYLTKQYNMSLEEACKYISEIRH